MSNEAEKMETESQAHGRALAFLLGLPFGEFDPEDHVVIASLPAATPIFIDLVGRDGGTDLRTSGLRWSKNLLIHVPRELEHALHAIAAHPAPAIDRLLERERSHFEGEIGGELVGMAALEWSLFAEALEADLVACLHALPAALDLVARRAIVLMAK